MPRTHKTKVCA